jgi:hypothetical protein
MWNNTMKKYAILHLSSILMFFRLLSGTKEEFLCFSPLLEEKKNA